MAETERSYALKKAREREQAREAREREQREQREQWARERMEEQSEREAWAREARARKEAESTAAGEREPAGAGEQQEHQERRGDDRRNEGARERARTDGPQDRGHREKRVDFDSMRRSSYAEYDANFVSWREGARREKTFEVRHIPLPPKGVVIEEAANSEAWGKHMNKAMLRWHPDKWVVFDAMLADEVSREALKQVVNGMFRAVLRAKERGPPPSARG